MLADRLQLTVLCQMGPVKILYLDHHSCWPGSLITLYLLRSLLTSPAQAPNFYSSKDVLSSIQQKKAEYHCVAPACSNSELLQRIQGRTEGWSKQPQHMGTLIISRWFCCRTTSASLYACMFYTQTHFPYTLLQAQTIYCCAKHKINLTGSMIWSSTFWTKEKCLQWNCIQMQSDQCCLPPLLCLPPLCPWEAQIRGKPFGEPAAFGAPRLPIPARRNCSTARVLL